MSTPLINQLGVVQRNITRADRAATEKLGALAAPPCMKPWAGWR